MNEDPNKKGQILKRALKIFLSCVLWTSVTIISVCLLVLVAIQLPTVQDQLTARLTAFVTDKIKAPVQLQKIRISFSGEISIHELYLPDRKGDTILYLGLARVRLNMRALFSRKISLSSVELENATVRIKRPGNDSLFNFNYIINAFASKDTAVQQISQDSTSAWLFSIDKVRLKNVLFAFNDSYSGTNVETELGSFETDLKELDLSKKIISAGKFQLKNTSCRIKIEESKNVDTTSAPPFDFAIGAEKIILDTCQLAYIGANNERLDVSVNALKIDNGKEDAVLKKITANKLFLSGAKVAYLVDKTDSEKVRESEQEGSNDTVTSQPIKWNLALRALELHNNQFSYNDNSTAPNGKQSFDPSHLGIKNISMLAKNIYLSMTRSEMDLKDLTADEQNGLRLKKFSSRINFDTTHIELSGLDLRTSKSKLSKRFSIRYATLRDLSQSPEDLELLCNFDKAIISFEDVYYFVPAFKNTPIKEDRNRTLSINGKINGKVNDLVFKSLELRTEKSTSFKLSGRIRGVTTPTNIHCAIPSFELAGKESDLLAIFSPTLIPASVHIPSDFRIIGSLNGSFENFEAKADVNSSFGKLIANCEMKDKAYSVKANLENFDIGKLLKQSENLGAVTMSLLVKGSGFDTASLHADVDASVKSVSIKKYEYRDLNLKATINKKAIACTASLNDRSILFDFNVALDLEPAQRKIKFVLNLKGADFKALNLTESDIRLSALVQSDILMSGNGNIAGKAGIVNGLLIKNGKKFPVDSVVLIADTTESKSTMRLSSSIADAELTGNIKPTHLPQAFKDQINQYFKIPGANNKRAKQEFNFTFNLKDPSIISQILIPKFEKLTPFTAKGYFNSETKTTKVQLEILQVSYSGIRIDSLNLNAKSDSGKLEYHVRVTEVSNESLKLENFELKGNVKNGELAFDMTAAKDKGADKIAVAGTLKNTGKEYELKLKPDLILSGDAWTLDDANRIVTGKDGIFVRNFKMSSGTQSVSLNTIGEKPHPPLEIDFRNFEINSISRAIENKKDFLKGTINGHAVVEKHSGQTAFSSSIQISGFVFRGFPVGDLKLNADNYEDTRKYDVDLVLTGNGNDIKARGFYDNGLNSRSVVMNFDINSLNLQSVEPFVFGEIKRMSGTIQGNVKVNGKFTASGISPDVNGELQLKECAFNPRIIDSYLKVHDGKLLLADKKIRFNNFIVFDSLNNKAVVNGYADFGNLQNIMLDLKVKSKDFLAMNTNKKDNPLYYGVVFLNSDIHLTGSTKAPAVNLKAKLNKGSAITYVKPRNQVVKDEGKGIVEFAEKPGGGAAIMFHQKNNGDSAFAKGIDLHAEIDFDKEAVIKVIIDPVAGDSLYIKGGGLLDFTLDRSGRTSLNGKYRITDGGYFLTINEVVKRNFKIERGSTVTWTGDIMDAYVDLKAIYIIKTSPIDLVQNELSTVSELEKNKFRNLLTFHVYLKMRGYVSSPEISFDIQLAPRDRGAMNGAINTKLAQLATDETQLNKQVFALLTLKRFVSENPLESGSTGGLESASRSSASQILSSQLNALTGKYVNFVDLDLGVNSFEDYSTGREEGRTQLQVGVSKKLLNDKVTVRVGGNVEMEGERARQNNANDMAGNINIDYKLTDDGRFKLKAFRENQYENPIEGELTKTGAGIIFTRNFTKFRELLKKPQKRAKRNNED